MNDLLRSFGRALSSVLHPRMLWLTFMPFAAAAIVWGVVLWFSWQTLIGATRGWLESWPLTTTLYGLFDWLGFSSLHAAIAPFIVVAMAIPLIVVTVLLLIATPVLRVAVSIFGFALEKDRAYAIITSVVLVLLLISFGLGKAG